MIKAIVFDADNTLYEVRTDNAYRKEFGFLGGETGMDPKKIETTWRSVLNKIKNSADPKKRNREYSTEKSLILLGVRKREAHDLTRKSLEVFWDQIAKDTTGFRNTKNVIKKLCENYVLAIASDEFRDNLNKKLDKVIPNWKMHFKFVITPEVTKTMKPSAKYYRVVLKKLDMEPREILIVGDSIEREMMPAKSIGMNTLLIKRPQDLARKLTKYLELHADSN